MANYYVSGYTPPAGYTNSDSVRQLQQALNAQGANLKVDGIYGPKTHAAYSNGNNAAAGGGAVSYLPQQYKNYVSELQALLKPNTISYTPTSKEDYASMIQQALRPGYDLAISQRKDATKTNKAEIDADAAARGMGASTWVTDVKDRQSQSEADDISTLESQYAAAYASQLMDALDREKQNQLVVDQFNAGQMSDYQAQALGLADSFYNQYLSQQKTRNGGGGGGNDEITLDTLDMVKNWQNWIAGATSDENKKFRLEQLKKTIKSEETEKKFPNSTSLLEEIYLNG